MHRFFILLLIFCGLCPAAGAAQEAWGLGVGEPLPDFVLTAPQEAEHRAYLGIGGATFSPHQIDAEVVLLELFNVHCPDCWARVPDLTELFFTLTADPTWRQRIKLLAVAVGNDSRELADFVERELIAYPVVADPDSAAAAAVGATATPWTLCLRQGAGNQPAIVADIQPESAAGHAQMFEQLQALARHSHEQLRREGEQAALARAAIEAMASRSELEYQVRTLMVETGGVIRDFSAVALRSGRCVFTAVMEWGERRGRLFAEVVNGLATGAQERAAQFIYVFDEAGTVVAVAPLQSTRKGRRNWSRAEIAWLRQHLVGRTLGTALSSDEVVDRESLTDSPSTVASLGLAQGGDLLQELRAKQLLGD